MQPEKGQPDFTRQLTIKASKACLEITGRLDAANAAKIWKQTIDQINSSQIQELNLDLQSVTYLNTAGASFIIDVEQGCLKQNKAIVISNLDPAYKPILDLARNTQISSSNLITPQPLSFIEQKGKKLADILSDTREFITFVGQITGALFQSMRNPGSIRWADTIKIAERAGVDALPIVALISFIVGLVMAFQAAIPMRMFGAELYVANLIGISMVRELAPLMTAIVLAGRSASAFAAEIGTMRINEEIDALTVMGLDPVRFLIIPRVIASTIMTPLLTIFANLMGMLGGALVILSFGYPIIAYYNQIVTFVGLNDFIGGLVKCFVFGILIAATGCIRGYQTKSGASAVGISTTRAVVSGIILIAVFDGIFSIVYYYLGI